MTFSKDPAAAETSLPLLDHNEELVPAYNAKRNFT